MKSLQGGLRLDGKKDATLTPWSALRAAPPRRVRIPLRESTGKILYPRVQMGDRVRVGEKIAEMEGSSPFAIHASISGTISALQKFGNTTLPGVNPQSIRGVVTEALRKIGSVHGK